MMNLYVLTKPWTIDSAIRLKVIHQVWSLAGLKKHLV